MLYLGSHKIVFMGSHKISKAIIENSQIPAKTETPKTKDGSVLVSASGERILVKEG